MSHPVKSDVVWPDEDDNELDALAEKIEATVVQPKEKIVLLVYHDENASWPRFHFYWTSMDNPHEDLDFMLNELDRLSDLNPNYYTIKRLTQHTMWKCASYNGKFELPDDQEIVRVVTANYKCTFFDSDSD